jgi:hypothetical protein
MDSRGGLQLSLGSERRRGLGIMSHLHTCRRENLTSQFMNESMNMKSVEKAQRKNAHYEANRSYCDLLYGSVPAWGKLG